MCTLGVRALAYALVLTWWPASISTRKVAVAYLAEMAVSAILFCQICIMRRLSNEMSPDPPRVTNEVIMEALRIRSSVALSNPAHVTAEDIAANLVLVGGAVGDETVRRQVVQVALAFAFPQAQQPG
jgi:hypothetical protein